MGLAGTVRTILDDDRLTRGLGDAEARLLVEWLVERAEEGQHTAAALCRRARAIARFVFLWCHQQSHAGACQLAATERFPWPLPSDVIDPYDLMAEILCWEQYPHEDRHGVE